MSTVVGARLRQIVGTPKYTIPFTFVIGLVGLVVSYYIPNPYTKAYPPMILVGGLLAAIAYSHYHRTTLEPPTITTERLPVQQLLFFAYFLLVATLAVLHLTAATFLRTLPQHVTLLVLYLVTAALIFTVKSTGLALGVVLVTGTIHRVLAYYASAIQIGLDTLFHNSAAAQIGATLSLEPLAFSKYWYAPVYHLFTGLVHGGFGIPVRDASLLTTTIPSTIVPVVGIFVLIQRAWSPRTAVLGGFLYLVADHVIAAAVAPLPMSLGLVLFMLMLVATDPYLDSGEIKYLGGFALVLLLLVFTHQLTLFIAIVGLGAYLLAYGAWNGRLGRRELTLFSLLMVGHLFQQVVTRYEGPRGDSGTFFEETSTDLLTQLLSTGGRGAAYPPESANVAVSGADALSVVQVAGGAILFAFAIVGAIYWVGRQHQPDRGSAFGYSAMVVGLGFFVFVPPIFGINFFLPRRWFAFLYIPAALLAAPGLVLLVSVLSGGKRVPLPTIVAVLLVISPYAVFMLMNFPGAIDNPALDDAPEARRLAVTAQEEDAYLFVVSHAGGTGTPVVVADHHSTQVLGRHYGIPAEIYRTEFGTAGTVYDGEQLYVYRAYDQTDHASYQLVYQGNRIRVFGSLPPPDNSQGIVYSNGDDVVAYRPNTTAT